MAQAERKKQTTGKQTGGASSRRTSSGKTTAKKKTTGRTGTKKTAAKRKKEAGILEPALKKELVILITLAVSVLLFCSNLGICGAFGRLLHKGMRGCFGLLGYAFPVCLFLAVCFLISNGGSRRAVIRVAVSFLGLIVLCGLLSLIALTSFEKGNSPAWYFTQALTEADGGMFGGLCLMLLYPFLGRAGSYVVLFGLVALGIVIVTQRSILNPIRRGSRKVYTSAKEDLARRQELHAARAEERRAMRADRKVRGVSLDVELPEEAQEEHGAAEYTEETAGHGKRKKSNEAGAAERGSQAANEEPPVFTGRIHGMTGAAEKNETEEAEEETKAETKAAGTGIFGTEIASAADGGRRDGKQEPLMAAKVDRTLSELEELDQEPVPMYRIRREDERTEQVWREEDPSETIYAEEEALPWETAGHHAEAPVEADIPVSHEKEFQNEPEAEPDWIRGIQSAVQEQVEKTEEVPKNWRIPENNPPETDYTWKTEKPVKTQTDSITELESKNENSGDTRRVMTATGKIIEVENDPTELDPLTAKRQQAAKERREAEERSAEPGQHKDGSRSVEPGTGGSRAGAGIAAARSGNGTAEPVTPPKPEKPARPYVKPPLRLLKREGGGRRSGDEELKETALKLEQTLRNFGVGVKVHDISCGPSVTRYELTPEQGVKVSKIVGLQDDIKLSLAAADIRIEAPIPGKSAVGIEVPNKEKLVVSLRDVLESDAFVKHPSKLAFAVGRDISGKAVVTDLAKMPHLLIAGATGSGKSVCINTLIMSILYKADPSEVKLLMVDPKVVELSVYNGIPHLMIPVVTDPKKAAGALNWAVAEMTDRYKKFAEYNVRDLKGYNERRREEDGENFVPLPQIVIIVDELSDLMMVAPGDVESAICRLAQMARAAGLHLVLATQRPSVNVITGLIKANVPSRIAFAVSSGVDSRTIIDINGAEKLLGRGDMLFYPSGYPKPERVQGAFVSDEEVSAVVKFLTDNTDTQYSQEMETRISSPSAGEGGTGEEQDEYFADAGRFLIKKEKASIGMIQRAFKVGFNRAARIMDQLAAAGVVGPEEGTQPRKIQMTPEEFEAYLGR